MSGQSLAFSRLESSASTASRMNSPRLFGPINASMRAITASESRTVVSFTPSAGRPMRRVVSDSCKSDKPIAFMLTDVTDSSYITTIGYGDKSMPTYSATFSDGSTKSIANSKREYAVAWRTVVQSNNLDHPTSFSGFSRDEATAWKAMRSERACIVNVGRWSKSGGTVVSEEVVSVTRGEVA